MLIHAVDKLESFLRHFPVFPNAFLVGGPADFFVIELADQVNFEKFSGLQEHVFFLKLFPIVNILHSYKYSFPFKMS